MSSNKPPKSFSWSKGEELEPDDYDVVPEVRDTGMVHLSKKTPAANPQMRIKERANTSNKIDQVYYNNSGISKKSPSNIIHDGEHDEMSVSNSASSESAKRLFERDAKFKGLTRFLKNPVIGKKNKK